MEKKYSQNDFASILCLKNQLIELDDYKLVEIYQDLDMYRLFLQSVALITNMDQLFLFLSNSFLDKILSVIQIHRFDDGLDPELRSQINNIIAYVNAVRDYDSDMRSEFIVSYFSYQQDARCVTFDNSEVFLESMAYDAIVYCLLKSHESDKIEQYDYFLASMSYFLTEGMEYLTDDMISEAVLKLETISKYPRPFPKELKKCSKDILSKIKGIN